MATKKKKTKQKLPPPASTYPAAPHIIGMDWVELPVRSPTDSAQRYVSIGFSPRPSTGQNRAVAIGGTVIVFKRQTATHETSSSGILLQMPVDHIELKRRQMLDLGLKVGAVRRQRRGDQAFQWHDGDGHTIRFVGPARRTNDKTLTD